MMHQRQNEIADLPTGALPNGKEMGSRRSAGCAEDTEPCESQTSLCAITGTIQIGKERGDQKTKLLIDLSD